MPFWLFDADADADIRYKATRVRTWSDSDYDYTETSYYSIGRSGDIGFDRVPVDGSSKMPDDLMESLSRSSLRTRWILKRRISRATLRTSTM